MQRLPTFFSTVGQVYHFLSLLNKHHKRALSRGLHFCVYYFLQVSIYLQKTMGRWLKPEVYPLVAAMTFVASMCVFAGTRNIFMNPDVRFNKNNRTTAIPDNAKEGEKYALHGFRKYLGERGLGIFPYPKSITEDK